MYLGALVGFANTILLYPKVLPKAEYGLISLLIGIAMLVSSISSFGTPNALIRFFPHLRDEKAKSTKGLVKYLVLISGCGTLIVALLMIVLQKYVFMAYENSAGMLVEYYYYIFPIFFIQVFINLLTSYLNVIKKSHVQVFQKEILIRLGQTALIGLYYFDVIQIDVFVLLIVLLYIVSLTFLLGYLLSIGEFRSKDNMLEPDAKKKVLNFSLFTFLSSIARQISFRIDSIMVGALVVVATVENSGLEAASIYAVALNMSSVLEMPFRALNQSLAPSISRAWAEKNVGKVLELYKKSTETMMAIGVYIAVGIWACVDQVLEILPDSYSEVKYVLGWLLLGKLLNVVAGANGVVMMNSPKFKVLTYVSFFGLTLTVISNYIFIEWYQIEGAAMATFVTYFILNFTIWVLILKYFKLQPFTFKNLLTIALGVAVLFATSAISVYGVWVTLLVKAGLITLVFWTVVYFTNLSPEIKGLVDKKVLPMLKRR